MLTSVKLRRFQLTFFLFLTLLVNSSFAKTETFNVGIDQFPPWTFFEDKQLQGIDIEIINSLADKLALQLNYVSCSFKRCLAMLKSGEVDLVPGLFKTPEREMYATFLEPAYLTDPPKVFYVNASKLYTINQYSDLSNLVIGIREGVSYFEQFDNDNQLTKVEASHESRLIKLLIKNRIDAFISTEPLVNYVLSKTRPNEKIVKVSYSHHYNNVTYLALSKKSKYVTKMKEFQNVIKRSLENGQYNQIVREYYEKYSAKDFVIKE
ncbi:amino acid ABC transporter substrate-binding protein [Thalassotalea sp. M1531]|uniref:Amino acid ABC transporter substrate-binding protein n=1 Tax=Thalassotalea algicola TaxID=2716224 RepID=A0A7Y0LEE9_9GAMM|nr:transporter substrate-binding domain-containing protein [Thalassotalea algicola]NMP32723.1 amino acid ABC transporter substrate-binding protein [Thalassotalea algicola]